MHARAVSAALSLALLAGCSGGSGSIPARTSASSVTQPSLVAAKPAVVAKIALTIPVARKPAYVSPSTLGLAISVYGSLATPPPSPTQVYDLSSTSSLCTTQLNGSRLCTLSISAPAGTDDFAVAAYDTAPSGGTISASAHLLSSGTTQAVIVSGSSNTITLSLGGVVNSLSIAPAAYSVPFGESNLPVPFAVQALDAHGNVIIGADAYVNPIALSLSDSSCATFSFTSSGPCAATETLTTATASGSNMVTVYSDGGTFSTNVTLTATTTTSSGTVTASALMEPGSANGTLTIPVQAYPTGGVVEADDSGTTNFFAPGYDTPYPPTIVPPTSPTPVPDPPGPTPAISLPVYASQVAFLVNGDGTTTTYVAYYNGEGGNEIDVYAQSDLLSGNPPTYVIDLPQMCFVDGVAVDSYGNVYASDYYDECYDYGGGAAARPRPNLRGRPHPAGARRHIAGSHRQVDADTADTIAVYRPSSYQSGSQPYSGSPDWTITGPHTGLNAPAGLAVDANNHLVVTNLTQNGNGVYATTVYGIGASGDAVPQVTIVSPNTSELPNQAVDLGSGVLISYALGVEYDTYDTNAGTFTPQYYLTSLTPAAVDSYGNLVGFYATDPYGGSNYALLDYAPNFLTNASGPFGFAIEPNDVYTIAAIPAGLSAQLTLLNSDARHSRPASRARQTVGH